MGNFGAHSNNSASEVSGTQSKSHAVVVSNVYSPDDAERSILKYSAPPTCKGDRRGDNDGAVGADVYWTKTPYRVDCDDALTVAVYDSKPDSPLVGDIPPY